MRNKLFDIGILTSKEFELPVISVGNLSVGGTGKSPMIEYLVRMLAGDHAIATLSRGYKRHTKGFHIAKENASAAEVGDEPAQFKKKFKELTVAVDANRVHGIKNLQKRIPGLEIVLLDDAFQHRFVKPSMNILLTEYSYPFYKGYPVPTGHLREFKSGYKRADIIIVTKTPEIFSPLDKRSMVKDIRPEAYQKVYFSYIKYGDFIPFSHKANEKSGHLSKEFYFERDYSVVLFTGIADASPLKYYLKGKVKELVHLKYRDHHDYSLVELMAVQDAFEKMSGEKKIVLTTEKDVMRLTNPGFVDILNELPLYYVPIEIDFHDQDKEEFNNQILNHVRTN